MNCNSSLVHLAIIYHSLKRRPTQPRGSRFMNLPMVSCAALAAALPIFPAAAQQAPSGIDAAAVDAGATGGGSNADTVPPTPGNASTAHPDMDQAIVVTGVKRAAGDVLGGVSVVN